MSRVLLDFPQVFAGQIEDNRLGRSWVLGQPSYTTMLEGGKTFFVSNEELTTNIITLMSPMRNYIRICCQKKKGGLLVDAQKCKYLKGLPC
jgi:hypothetical protein